MPTIAAGRDDLDITREEAALAYVCEAAPRAIINCAAYTAVDRAESEAEAAHAINALGPGHLAQAAAELDIPLLHVSTDYVFDGTKSGAYTEDDPVAPLGAYGHSKEEGERRVRAAHPKHVILRTSWVYGIYGNNFLKTMLRLSRERDQLSVVADQRGCPTATIDIARALLAVVAASDAGRAKWGTYHFAGSGVTTWHGFASEIVGVAAPLRRTFHPGPPDRHQGLSDAGATPRQFGTRLQPLRCGFRLSSPPWQERTREVVEALLAPAEAK